MGQVIVDTHGEVVLGLFLFEVLIHRVDHRGVELLGAQTIPAAHDLDIRHAVLEESGANVEVQGLAEGARFLGPIKHRELLDALRESLEECVHGEGAIQADLQEADLVTFLVHLVDGLLHGVCARAHEDDDVLRVGVADVVEEVIAPARESGDLIHHLLHDGGSGFVVFIGGLAVLEVDVRVLRRTALDGVLGVKSASAEVLDVLHIHEALHLVVLDHVDLADFVRSAETVEEVEERNFRLQGGEVGDKRKVHDLLHRVGREHRKTRLTASHHVRVIAENVESVRRKGTSAHVEDGGQQFARDLIHIGDHQEQALARGVSGGKRTCHEGAVHSARRAAFGLHLRQTELLPEHIHATLRRPFVGDLSHRRGRRDRIDRRNFREGIRNVARRSITVNSLFETHKVPPYRVK